MVVLHLYPRRVSQLQDDLERILLTSSSGRVQESQEFAFLLS